MAGAAHMLKDNASVQWLPQLGQKPGLVDKANRLAWRLNSVTLIDTNVSPNDPLKSLIFIFLIIIYYYFENVSISMISRLEVSEKLT